MVPEPTTGFELQRYASARTLLLDYIRRGLPSRYLRWAALIVINGGAL